MQTKNLLILLTLLLFSVTALAGLEQPAPVVVDLDGMSAQGDMITARNSKNEVEFIGCGRRAFEDDVGGTFQFGFCQAVDSEGLEAFCTTTNPELLESLNSMGDSSFMTFGWDENTECTRIGSSTQSFYLEKGKGKK